jgi:hypothetical protein
MGRMGPERGNVPFLATPLGWPSLIQGCPLLGKKFKITESSGNDWQGLARKIVRDCFRDGKHQARRGHQSRKAYQ